MKPEDFNKLVEETIEECKEILCSKGMAYSGQEDKLGNFKRAAKAANLEPIQIWYVYFVKHYDALCTYIRGEYCDSEPIEGRIHDLLNYLFLAKALVREAEEEHIRERCRTHIQDKPNNTYCPSCESGEVTHKADLGSNKEKWFCHTCRKDFYWSPSLGWFIPKEEK